VVWWCCGVVVWWCCGVVVWWCGGVVVWWCDIESAGCTICVACNVSHVKREREEEIRSKE
jgi:hypothetical protein